MSGPAWWLQPPARRPCVVRLDAGTQHAPAERSANDPRGHKVAMRVSVRLQGREPISYSGHYHHTFDAYDEAINRYEDAGLERVEVQLQTGGAA